MTIVTFSNYKDVLYDGARLLYDNRVGIAEKDSNWNGGYKVNGYSIKHLLEEFNVVELI